MIKQNLAVYSIPILYKILKELEPELDFNVLFVDSKDSLNKINNTETFILTHKENMNNERAIKISFPIRISKLIEKVNIQFIKLKTRKNSSLLIGDYILNLNSRILKLGIDTINLTEKEVNLILFLSNSKFQVSVEKLQSEVWGYSNKLETHTVETHIHRLRKKILDSFKKNNFILSDKKGYYLNKLS